MTKKTYSVATLDLGFDGSPTLLRRNDGSLVIMERIEDADGIDNRPCLEVPRVRHVKRSEAYSASDPDQEAFAQRVVDLLNGEAGA